MFQYLYQSMQSMTFYVSVSLNYIQYLFYMTI